MTDVLIHMNRPKGPSHIRECNAAVMEGEITEVVHRLKEKIARSATCEVSEGSGDFTRRDGPNQVQALWFEVTVTLEGSEPMVWEHIVTLPGQVWPLAIRTFDEYLEQVDRRAETMQTWRRGQVHFNVLENNRPDLAELVRGSIRDPFHDDGRIPEYLTWVGLHWDTEVSA